jgi:hypothetical protein
MLEVYKHVPYQSTGYFLILEVYKYVHLPPAKVIVLPTKNRGECYMDSHSVWIWA